MSDTLVKLENVSKKYCRSLKKSMWYGMLDLGRELKATQRDQHLRADEFWAIRDASFEINRGECLGLIGRNGAGKTTLLKMLNGLIKPDSGRIEIHGEVGALIALGAGFSQVLTGRENIYIAASVMGLSRKQADAKFDEIVEFSELGNFIDAPLRSYSSGMAIRLGFSVAAILIKPDVLLLDEVLAVGDIGFVVKCLNRLRLLSQNSAMILVSHNMQHISSFCSRVMVFEKGGVTIDTLDSALAIDRYYDMIQHNSQISGTGAARFLGLRMKVDALPIEEGSLIACGAVAGVELELELNDICGEAEALLYIHDEAMAPLICFPLQDTESRMHLLRPGRYRLNIPLGRLELNSGKYSFVLAIRDRETQTVLVRAQGIHPFRVVSETTYWGKIVRPASPFVLES